MHQVFENEDFCHYNVAWSLMSDSFHRFLTTMGKENCTVYKNFWLIIKANKDKSRASVSDIKTEKKKQQRPEYEKQTQHEKKSVNHNNKTTCTIYQHDNKIICYLCNSFITKQKDCNHDNCSQSLVQLFYKTLVQTLRSEVVSESFTRNMVYDTNLTETQT